MTTTEERIVNSAKLIGEAEENRFKVVRSVKNRYRYRIQKRINLYTSLMPRTKDKAKLAVLQGKIEALTYALTVVDQV